MTEAAMVTGTAFPINRYWQEYDKLSSVAALAKASGKPCIRNPSSGVILLMGSVSRLTSCLFALNAP